MFDVVLRHRITEADTRVFSHVVHTLTSPRICAILRAAGRICKPPTLPEVKKHNPTYHPMVFVSGDAETRSG